jgi:hypothetical protein
MIPQEELCTARGELGALSPLLVSRGSRGPSAHTRWRWWIAASTRHAQRPRTTRATRGVSMAAMRKRPGSVILVARYATRNVDAPASSSGSPGSSPLLPSHALPCAYTTATTTAARSGWRSGVTACMQRARRRRLRVGLQGDAVESAASMTGGTFYSRIRHGGGRCVVRTSGERSSFIGEGAKPWRESHCM